MKKKLSKNWVTLLILALAGGLVYKLPYLKYTYYESLIEALDVTNIQLGVLVSSFGVASMVCYFPGGWIADRFSPKNLLSFSFVAMGALGFYYSTFPSYNQVLLIHILFGAVICLTYWSVAIKAVRLLSSGEDIGKMFGFWEGGKQISGFFISYLALAVFATFDEAKLGIRSLILIYSTVLVSVGILLFILLKNVNTEESNNQRNGVREVFGIVGDSKAWLIALMIFSAYHFHIGLNSVNPYLTSVFGLSVEMASGIANFVLYVVGFAGSALAGVMVDRIGSTLNVVKSMILLAIVTLIAFIITPTNSQFVILVIILWGVAQFANFAIRGIYFSTLNEINIPSDKTGLFIGFASFIGFIPDTFMHIMTGAILDKFPGALGYKIIFGYMLLMVAICLLTIMKLVVKFKNESVIESK